MEQSNDLLVGSTLGGRYRIEERIARGGMACVYRSTDLRLDRQVAVKVMHEALRDDLEFGLKFQREARAAARLVHPNVVAVLDHGRDEDRPYIVMELVEGETLRRLISREAPLSPSRALHLMEPILAALSSAHDISLVHRDVKPENVLLGDTVKVADFGLAKAVSGDTVTATAGLLMGTVSYIPPEVVEHGRAEPASDVYSAGVMLFEMLTGHKPHTGDSPIQVAWAHCHKDVPPPSTLAPTRGPRESIPAYLDALVTAATARDTTQRIPDAREFLHRLRAAMRAIDAGVTGSAQLEKAMSTVAPPDDVTTTRLPAVPASDATATGTAVLEAPTRRRTTPATPVSPVDWGRSPAEPPPPARRNPVPHGHRQPSRRWRAWAAALVGLSLLMGIGYSAWWTVEGRWTDVPAMIGMPRDVAVSTGREAHLSVRTETVHSETVPVGTVVSTEPSSPARVKADTEVVVFVSRGPERYDVPTVVGLTTDRASAALTAQHLKLGTVTPQWHEKVAKGVVVSASLAKGTQVKPGTAVDVVVSKGRQPIPIPSGVGKPAAALTSAAKKAGFVVKATEAHSTTVAKGSIISQKPAKGTGHRGDTITIVVSRGPEMVMVPNTRMLDTAQARTTLEQAGFTVVVKTIPNPVPFGKVSYTSPAGGKDAPKGSTVSVFVA